MGFYAMGPPNWPRLRTTAHHYPPLSTTIQAIACHCLPLHTTAYHCIPWSMTTRMSLIANNHTSSDFIAHIGLEPGNGTYSITSDAVKRVHEETKPDESGPQSPSKLDFSLNFIQG